MINEKDIKVNVLMSTYNGEKYIEEQINSILFQNFKGLITIIIRDDGSNDGTVQTIENIFIPYNRSIVIIPKKNVGPQKSFLKLINYPTEADYFFFSDQDDVWEADKIRRGVSKMSEFGYCCLYCSDYAITNSHLQVIKSHCIELKSRIFTPLRVILYNEFPGCTMGFDKKFMHLLRQIRLDNVMMHDSMALALAASIDSVCFDPQTTVYHRIHSDNVIGFGHKKIKPFTWIIEKTSLIIHKDSFDLSKLAEQLLIVGDEQISANNIKDLTLLRDFKKSYFNTLKLLCHPDSQNKLLDRTTLSIRCKIFFHVF